MTSDSDAILDRVIEHLPGARRYTRYVAGVCPFHTDSAPSLLVYPDGYRCTACGARGPVEKLLNHLGSHPLAPAPRKSSYFPNIPPGMDNERLARSAHAALNDAPGLRQYLVARGLGRAIRPYRLGYWEGWYTIPIRDRDNTVDEIVFRAGPWVQNETGARFWQRSGQRPRIYCPDWDLLDGALCLVVTFGMFDAVTFALEDVPAVTSTIGKGSFKAEWLDWWDGLVLIVPDLQEEKEAHLLAAALGWRGRVWLPAYPDGCKDPNDLLQHDPDQLRSVHELIRNLTNS